MFFSSIILHDGDYYEKNQIHGMIGWATVVLQWSVSTSNAPRRLSTAMAKAKVNRSSDVEECEYKIDKVRTKIEFDSMGEVMKKRADCWQCG